MNPLQTILVSVSLSVAVTSLMFSGYLPNLFVWNKEPKETIEHVPAEANDHTHQLVDHAEPVQNPLKPYEIYA